MLSLKRKFIFFVMVLLSVTQLARASTDLEKALQGRWLSEITQEIPKEDDLISGVLKIIGVEEYLGNGSVNIQGQLLMTFNYKNGSQIIASWLINGAGEWQVKDGRLYEKVVDVRASPDFVKLNANVMSPEDQKDFFQQSGFKIEDLIPKGHTTESEIVSVNDKSLVYKEKNDQGTSDVKNKTRTNAAFSLYRLK
jgi:hypothetical protein